MSRTVQAPADGNGVDRTHARPELQSARTGVRDVVRPVPASARELPAHRDDQVVVAVREPGRVENHRRPRERVFDAEFETSAALRLRPGLSVYAISNAVGGLIPVPAPARILVQVPPSGTFRYHANEIFGLTDQTMSFRRADAGRTGRLRGPSARCVRRARQPSGSARGTSAGRASTNQPEIDRVTGTACAVLTKDDVLSARS